MPSLLDQRIPSIIEGHGSHYIRALCLLEQFPGLGCGGRQRLIRHDMFAFCQGRGDDGVVQMIRSCDMHDLHVGVINQRLVVPITPSYPKLLRLSPSGLLAASSNRDDVYETQAPDCIDMMRPHESRADNSHP